MEFLIDGGERECQGNQECVRTKARELERLAYVETHPNVEAFCSSGNCTNGKGVYLFAGGYHEGMYKDGKPNGKGVLILDGTRYEGMFKDGKKNGKGIQISGISRYEGMFKNGSNSRRTKTNRIIMYL